MDDLQDLRPDISDDLSRSVEAALSNEGLLAHDYVEPSEFVRNNFAEAELDEESDRRAEATVWNHVARAEEVERLGQAFRDVQHMKLHGLLLGRAYFDTSAELSRLGRGGVFNGRMPYGSVFGPQDLTEDEFNFGRGSLDGIYFDDMMDISGRRRPITVPIVASNGGGGGDSGDEGEAVDPEDELGVEIRIEGPLDISTSHERLVLDQSVTLHFNGTAEFEVLGKSPFNAFVVLVETEAGQQLWIDLKEHSAKEEDSAKYEFIGAENLADIPYIDESVAIPDNPYENTLEGTVDILPIAAEDIDWVLEFGVPGDAWKRTAGVHPGVDFFAPAGTEVVAIAPGEVIAVFVPADVNYEHVYGASVGSNTADLETPEIAGSIYDPQTVSARARQWYADDWVVERSQRAYVIVRSGNGFITYGHLDPNSIQVGTHVMAGQPIGTVGKDDQHEGNDHLHLEVRVHGHNDELLDASGEYIHVLDDPLNQSMNYRPPVYPNTLYLFTEEMRQRIVEDYDLKPLADQLLAIDGNSTYSHNGSTLSDLWLESTSVIPRGRGT
ncbi:MAG: M23 family metallopeptidase [Chloroflexi bacterium]|nr:M23 family metallopeptidase [Chloroflexota bacterium]